MPNKISLPSTIKNTKGEGDFPQVEIIGYTGRVGVGEMLTMADKGGRGGIGNADNG